MKKYLVNYKMWNPSNSEFIHSEFMVDLQEEYSFCFMLNLIADSNSFQGFTQKGYVLKEFSVKLI